MVKKVQKTGKGGPEKASVHAQSCLTLCDTMDHHPSGSSAHGIFQTRILEGVPFPTPGDLSNPRIKLLSPASLALAGGFFTTEPPGKPKRKHRGSKHRQQQPSSGWKQREKGRPLGFGSLERVLGEAGTQYAAQLVLVPHTGHKEAGSG